MTLETKIEDIYFFTEGSKVTTYETQLAKWKSYHGTS